MLSQVARQNTLFTALDKDSAEVFSDILRFCNDHFHRPLDLETIAQRFGYHPTYLSKLFVQKMGCKLTQYIHELRIDRAKQMLTDDALSLKQVAISCGFGSFRTFNRVFFAREGISPSAYRKAHATAE